MNIPPDEISYSEAAYGLDAAFEYSHDADADLWVERCISDLAQLWNYGDLYAVTEVRETKAGRALHIVAMAGEFHQELMNEMEAWGKSVGCKHSYFSGRRGWARKLPDYREITVTLSKEL